MAKVKLLYLPSDVYPVDNPINVTGEHSAITRAIFDAHPGAIEVTPEPDARTNALQQLNRRHMPTIVHISAHGIAASEDGATPARIRMFGPDGPPIEFEQSVLAADLVRFGAARARVVVLNVCDSLALADAVTRTARSKIDAIVCMNGKLEFTTAPVFSGGLYAELARGKSLQDAFDVAVNTAAAPDPAIRRIAALRCRKGVDPRKLFPLRRSLAWMAIPILAAAALAGALAFGVKRDPYLQCMEERLAKVKVAGDTKEMATRFRALKGHIDASPENLDDTLVDLAMRPSGWQILVDCGAKANLDAEMDMRFDVTIGSESSEPSKGKTELAPTDPKRFTAHQMTCRPDGRCQIHAKATKAQPLLDEVVVKRDGHQQMTFKLTDLMSKRSVSLKPDAKPVSVSTAAPAPTVTGTHPVEVPPPSCDASGGAVKQRGGPALRKGAEVTINVEVNGAAIKSISGCKTSTFVNCDKLGALLQGFSVPQSRCKGQVTLVK